MGNIALLPQIIIPLMSMAVGAGIAWGVLRQQMQSLIARLDDLEKWRRHVRGDSQPNGQPLYVPRAEFIQATQALNRELDGLRKDGDDLGKHVQAIENYVRWTLTTKEGMSLEEANRILARGE